MMNCSVPSYDAHSSPVFNFTNLTFITDEPHEEGGSWMVAQMIIYIVIMTASLLGNLAVILAILTQRAMRTTINYYLLNMAFADTLIVIFCMWVHFVNEYIYSHSYKLGPFMCRIEAFAKMTCMTACVLTLCAISCDRFIAIIFPLHAQARITKQRTSCVILIIWIVSGVVATPLIVYSKLYTVQFAGSEEVSYCGTSWPGGPQWSAEVSECLIVYPIRKLYYTIVTVTLFFLPIGIMLTAYSFIVWKLWISTVPGEHSAANNNVHNKSKKKVITMVCYVMLAFMICWMPLQATVLCSQFGDSEANKQMPRWFSWFSSAATSLAFSNSLVNPIIYGGFNSHFRQAILRLIRCRTSRVQAAKMRWSSRDGTMALRRTPNRIHRGDNCPSIMSISNIVT